MSTTIAETKVLAHLTVLSWRPAAELAIVRVAGEVDLLTAQMLQETVDQALDRPPLVLVIDLSAVTFFGASGLTVLVAAREVAQQTATVLRLVCRTRVVTRPLAVVGLDHGFETYNDLETALPAGDWPGSAGLGPRRPFDLADPHAAPAVAGPAVAPANHNQRSDIRPVAANRIPAV